MCDKCVIHVLYCITRKVSKISAKEYCATLTENFEVDHYRNCPVNLYLASFVLLPIGFRTFFIISVSVCIWQYCDRN